ncbi:3-hydroxyacyl-CoA dehydrogenase NAD-binding domain-containing protein [Conexibacter sp. JD483]|uniref:3-hydroxyacyl-CoA dehydrogenase NAD-binding domain-containing protein n=1 Tax=unclassified Conexibacter TaxID=2627773 RepID=UPI0027195DB1|nr:MULTISPECIES: 3-hydroxyacyl-CoA dehydrogenase NAD-binding domain-containing protein [unclassified Conexibacter]MDO8187723.1 3-hydroxyacyl-CoA dehydrogenase NAD-binding domain-containing protein [Conexibacter sp. CPCC 205706]MDO8200226.1 3-hydroxyacyl-CoA dehydrogenase NAD-binding domain-containing protein [Conexibacter sp. CPCC 205762]MDR9369402.1 3-hydroxyacyl-CoA dehydrogenase NAD-binding domain-containing protein [Conexibacter sp. JD483]
MAIPRTIGVVGAGTMGAGIAQLAAQAGARTLLHDPVPQALERGLATVAAGLDRQVARGRLSAADAAAIRARVEPAASLEQLAPCGLVIEAAPERLDLKLDLFERLAEIAGPECVLATNTSSLSVAEIAAGVPGPERVVGLHFFNPAPVMKLAEVVPGVATAPEVVATARAVGEAMGKRVIDAADIAGFLVNRVNRPFFLEALRIVQDGQATVEQVDRVVRMAGGFRMGPFELMDLIGIETNHAVAEGFYRQTLEPRYRPSPLAARMVAAGRLGRKTGQGWYSYADGAGRPADPEPPAAGGGDGRPLTIAGEGPALDALREAAREAGWEVGEHVEPYLTIEGGTAAAGGSRAAAGADAAPRARFVAGASLHLTDPQAAGIHLLAPLDGARLVELTRTPRTDPLAAARTEELVRTLGRHPEWVGDGPGLVLGRIVAQLVNEAAFLVGEGNGTPADVDAGMELGVNHPRGPIAWSAALGLPHVLATLDGLSDELREERYRAAPLLRRRAALGARLG